MRYAPHELCAILPVWMFHVSHSKESWHINEWVMAHIWMRHATHGLVMSHMFMIHVSHSNESHHKHQRATSHIWVSHVTHINESRHVLCRGWTPSIKGVSLGQKPPRDTATHCNTLRYTSKWVMTPINKNFKSPPSFPSIVSFHFFSLLHTATHWNALRNTLTHCAIEYRVRIVAALYI